MPDTTDTTWMDLLPYDCDNHCAEQGYICAECEDVARRAASRRGRRR